MILCSFLSTILINRMLGPVQKGRYAYIINIVEILYLILSFGLGQTYSQFARNDDKRIKQIIHFLIFLHSTICIIIFSIFFIIFSSKSLIIIGVLTSISILSNNISMIAVIENSINRNITISLFKIAYIFLLCIGSICTNISFYLCLIFYGVYELSTSIYFLFKYKLYKTSFKFDLNDLKHIYSNGIIIMLVLVLTTINYSIDSIMLEKISGSFYTGVYSVATTFGNIALGNL